MLLFSMVSSCSILPQTIYLMKKIWYSFSSNGQKRNKLCETFEIISLVATVVIFCLAPPLPVSAFAHPPGSAVAITQERVVIVRLCSRFLMYHSVLPGVCIRGSVHILVDGRTVVLYSLLWLCKNGQLTVDQYFHQSLPMILFNNQKSL